MKLLYSYKTKKKKKNGKRTINFAVGTLSVERWIVKNNSGGYIEDGVDRRKINYKKNKKKEKEEGIPWLTIEGKS